MDYSKRKTAAKVAVPAVVLLGGGPVLQWIGSHIGIDIPDDTANKIIIGAFSVFAGVKNWWSNRKRGR